MKIFDSWQSFWTFQSLVKIKDRYFRDSQTEDFLETVLESSAQRKIDLHKDKFLWRAQLGHDWEPIHQGGEYMDDVPAPYPPERMKPLVNEAPEGRANPKGIPYLYLATTKETAMAETRPWLGSLVSVGQFKTMKDLVLIDCSINHNKTPIYLEEPGPEERERAVWSHIEKAFSAPMTNNDKGADYVPTQILAEFFKKISLMALFIKVY